MPYEIFKSGPKKGQPKKLADRVVRYLEEGCGAKELPSSSKYRKFFRSGHTDFIFVGSNGAVRIGTSASNSSSRTDLYHSRMKLWENNKAKS